MLLNPKYIQAKRATTGLNNYENAAYGEGIIDNNINKNRS